MNTIYIAGPMTKIAHWNHIEFARWSARLRASGYAVISPAESFGGEIHFPRKLYMRKALHSLLQVDGIFLLQGWRDSDGAVLNWMVAKELGLPILQEHDVYHGLRREPIPEIWRAVWNAKIKWESLEQNA